MLEGRCCAAIDLGASSGRVAVVGSDGERLWFREARRFPTPRARDPETGFECWGVDAIEHEIREGLRAAAAMAPLESVGVDGWGVDYVLLDADQQRVGPAVSYRDERTRDAMERVLEKMRPEEIYRRTGIQFQPFNTLYQLAATAQAHPRWLERARRLLMLPDYFHFRLGGAMANEYTNATTTQLVDAASGDWDDELFALAAVSRELVSTPVAPGTILGEAGDVDGVPAAKITAPGTHDTASAVAAIPLESADELFISSGTWSLMGVESERPIHGELALRRNVSNEGGLERRYRVLQNIAGLWLTQCIGRELGKSEAALLAAAEAAPAWVSVVDPDDRRFLNPPSMIAALTSFCVESGQPQPASAGALVRCALESLALSYRRVKSELELLLERPLTGIRIGGGGGRNALLNQLTADACGVPVHVGPIESSLLGNGCAQLIGLGAIESLAAARAIVRRSFSTRAIEPRGAPPDAILQRFESLVRRRLQPERASSGPPRREGATSS